MLFLGIETEIIFFTMKKIILSLAAATLMGAQLNAQTYLEGTVTDHKTGDVLPFVNIAISGTSVGTISDMNGEFKLSVPDNLSAKDLTFSSVGFSPVTYKVSDLVNQHSSIALEPMDLKIEEVVVTDKSEAGRKVVKTVLDNITQKYVDSDFSYSGNYVNKFTQNGASRTATYVFNAYDRHGYSRGADNNAFAALNYKFASVKRDFKVNNYELGVNYFDFVSGLDFVRCQLGVMNSFTLKDFDFKIKSDQADRYVIEFKCNKPSLLNTGAYLPEKYSGTITISKGDNIVLESEYQLDVRNINLAGMSLRSGAQGNKGNISCKIAYDKFNGRYAMKTIHATISVSGAQGGDITIEDDISVTALNFKTPSRIEGKVFFSR